jgi:hypothetical protein
LVVAHETGHFGDFDGALPRERMGLKKCIGNVGWGFGIGEQRIQTQSLSL